MKRSASSIGTSVPLKSPKNRRTSKASSLNSFREDEGYNESPLPGIGIIEKITLRNFMCHSILTMKFSQNVNFIVGKNGSGKSAILTGIVIGLGGKASSTSRGTSLKTLIKEGCNSASIEIILRNVGEEAYKPDVYGDKIIVERRIVKDGQSHYKLKNNENKVISSKKEDLTCILEQFNIYVDNPLTCLNQEMSKHFLHSKSESDKYKFFMKSTQLEQMFSDYGVVKDTKAKMHDILKQRERTLPDLEKEVLEKEQRFKNLSTIQDLKTKVGTLKNELVWAHVAQDEVRIKPIERQINSANARTEKFDKKLKDLKTEESKENAEYKKTNERTKKHLDRLKELNPLKEETKNEMDKLKYDAKSCESARGRIIQQRRENLRDRQEITNKIKEMQNDDSTDVEKMRLEREKKIDDLNQLKQSLDAKYKTVTHQNEQFIHAINHCKENIAEQKRIISEAEQNKQHVIKVLKSLQQKGSNRLQLFGLKMPEFVKKIEDAWKRGKFKHKPRGPIGLNITMKDGSLAVPVEKAIRNFLCDFIVDNPQDYKVLESIKHSVFTAKDSSSITIYTSQFTNHIHNVSSGRTNHPNFPTLMDLINVADPVVFNLLIDMASIETILVIPKAQDAIEVMQNLSGQPRNSTKAYTLEGDEVYPDRYYSNNAKPISRYLKADVQDEIKRIESEILQTECTLDGARKRMQEIVTDLRSQEDQKRKHEREIMNINGRLRSVNQNLRKLETPEVTQTLDLKDLEDEVENYTQQIATNDALLKEETDKLDSYNKKLTEVSAKYKGYAAEIKTNRDYVDSVNEELEKCTERIEKLKADYKFYQDNKSKHLSHITELETERDRQAKIIADEIKKAESICKERISTRRSPQNIQNEIHQIEIRIEQEEKNHGKREEIIRDFHDGKQSYLTIRKRIRWIRKFIELIDSYMKKRVDTCYELRSLLSVRCRVLFDTLLNQRGFQGKVIFHHKQKRLDISVQPKEIGNLTKDMKALSGGERSFSTVCFILTLWDEIESPFRCLDEFDVFMDMANRRVAMEMMVDIALKSESKQFIFLTPLDIRPTPGSETKSKPLQRFITSIGEGEKPARDPISSLQIGGCQDFNPKDMFTSSLPNTTRIRVWKMQDPDRTQQTLPFQPI